MTLASFSSLRRRSPEWPAAHEELGKVGTHEGTTHTADATKKEVKDSIAELDALLNE